jgi:hypothetical protein
VRKSVMLVTSEAEGDVLRPGERTPEEWAAYVREPLERMGSAAIETGQRLLEAEAALAGPGVMDLYKRLGIHSSTGARFKAISLNHNIRNFARVQTLPAAWGTLYELTRLTAVQWDYGIASGLINPQMDRKDVAKIRSFDRRERSPARLNAD